MANKNAKKKSARKKAPPKRVGKPSSKKPAAKKPAVKKSAARKPARKKPAAKKLPAAKPRRSSPSFDRDGVDRHTFAPVTLFNALATEWRDVRVSFGDWQWLGEKYGESVDDYYLNGYGVEGLTKACRLQAGLAPEDDGIDFNSEADTCYIHFSDLDEAIKTAQLLTDMLHDGEKLRAMIKIARKHDFED